MIPPSWMIEQLERQRREREAQERPQPWIEIPAPCAPASDRSREGRPRQPIVIELA